MHLIRGALRVAGVVAWSDANRAGLKFSASIDVQQWRAAPTNTDQQRVDEIVRLVKAGAVPLDVALPNDPSARSDASSEDELARDLRRVTELLDELGRALAGDQHVVMRHGTALQNLDIASQIIAAVESILSRQPDPDCNAAAKLSGLRRSAAQALGRDV
jgi:hypothetical protein